jgi:hypothetical protein
MSPVPALVSQTRKTMQTLEILLDRPPVLLLL